MGKGLKGFKIKVSEEERLKILFGGGKMFIWIEHSKTRRRIKGAFNICGSRDDLKSIATQILGHLEADETMSHGIIEIRAYHQKNDCDLPIREWDNEYATQ